MPPRKEQQAGRGQEPDPEAVEAQRRTDLAFDSGVLSRTRRLCSSTLPPTKQMLRADGKDISKKASIRKGRYLMVFNFQLAPAAAGKLGTLACLDSKNPVLYLDFPQGRYKLFGTLVFPRNKYMVLKLGQKEVLCEDVFESMVVFSEGWWIGTAAENPEDRRLPEPDWLAAPKLHAKFDFSGRGAASGAGAKEAEPAEEEEEEEEPASQRPKRRASRAAGGKRLRYAEDSDGGAAASDDSEEEEEEEAAPRKLPRLGCQPARQQCKAQARHQPESHPIDLAGSDSEEGAAGAAVGAAKQGTLDAFVKRSGSQPAAKAAGAAAKAAAAAGKAREKGKGPVRGAANSAKRKVAVSSDDEEYVDLAGSESSEDEGPAGSDDEAPPSSARPRSQRKAAGAASQKLRVEHDSDDDEVDSQEEQEDSGASGASEEEAASGRDEESDSDGGGSDYAPSD